MRAETSFLKQLDYELRFLKPKDREEFTSNYRLQIYDRFTSGEKIIDIIDGLESPELIAKNIYNELEINVDQLKAGSYKTSGIMKILLGITTIIPQGVVFILAITSLILSATFAITTLFMVIMLWINFQPLQAIGGTLLSIGLLPLFSILFYYIWTQIYKFEKMFFKISVELMLNKEFKMSVKEKEVKDRKILKIVMISLFTVFTVTGAIGSFSGDKTIGGASLSKNMINSFERDVKDYEFNGEILNVEYDELENDSWYDIVFVPDVDIHGIRIQNDHNYKSSLTFNYKLVKTNQANGYEIVIIDVPWSLVIFNISSSIYTIKYNPNEVEF
ncbi:DUF1700 domain-containing protein [Spiroplasma endosymbiont of Othius punctulatus]|uniref:DUF1700 domain-containing protein n=1 Tax=Spiroplasma endosymbiont of Othius punctulatus TaxID=3066289 RepID=UPI0030D3A7D6